MLNVAFVILLLVAGRGLNLGALVWAPVLFCAVAAMHWTASLHLADPLAPLYAFIAVAFAGRCACALAADLMRPRTA